MKHNKIQFHKMDWENIAPGAKQKVFESPTQRIRLLHLDANFEEVDWCTNGHVGYVLKGSMSLQFSDTNEIYTPGDAFIITQGESEKHKATIHKGDIVELILVENL